MDAKKLKLFAKGAAAKPTFGSNPLDPWSAKANISESGALEQYLLSRGINPAHLSMPTKVAHAKSSQFLKWRRDHMKEEHDAVKKPLKKEGEEPAKGNQNSEAIKNEERGHQTSKGSGPLTAEKKSEHDKAQAHYKEIKTPRGPGSHNEEVQLDELKKSTLKSYIKGAMKDREERGTAASFKSGAAGDKYNKADETPKDVKREKGIDTALNKLTKEETVNEVSSELLGNYKDKAKKSADMLSAAGKHKKAADRWMSITKATGKQIQHTTKAISKSLNREDVGDPKAAVNADGLNTQMDTMRAERSKSARIIKSLYKKKGVVKEDLYDHEKEDKSVATYGKKPKHDKADDKDSKGENKPRAAAVLSGGTTLTGSPRDTVEIDPMMRVRPGQPDPTKKDDKKKDDKKDEFKKDK